MPIFEFRCVACGEVFETLFRNSGETAEIVCPHCHSENLERVLSRTNYAVGSGSGTPTPQITTRSCGGGGNQCMTLDLPGHSR